MKVALVIFSLFLLLNVACGVNHRLKDANIDFINFESNNKRPIPQVVPPNQKKGAPVVTPTVTTTAKPTQQLPQQPKTQTPKPVVVSAPTSTTTPASKVKQLAKNYDDRVSEIGKQVAAEKGTYDLNGSDFPALPKNSGNVPQAVHGTRSWASVVASDKPKNSGTKV